LLGELNAVQVTLIEESEYEAIVGALIVEGMLLILAPEEYVEDQVPYPIELCACTLTLTEVSNERLNGVAVNVLIGIVHDNAEITVDVVPSQ
jgi:hypothetical protein